MRYFSVDFPLARFLRSIVVLAGIPVVILVVCGISSMASAETLKAHGPSRPASPSAEPAIDLDTANLSEEFLTQIRYLSKIILLDSIVSNWKRDMRTLGKFDATTLVYIPEDHRNDLLKHFQKNGFQGMPDVKREGDALVFTKNNDEVMRIKIPDIREPRYIINGVSWVYTPHQPFNWQMGLLEKKLDLKTRPRSESWFHFLLPDAVAAAFLVPIVGNAVRVVVPRIVARVGAMVGKKAAAPAVKQNVVKVAKHAGKKGKRSGKGRRPKPQSSKVESVSAPSFSEAHPFLAKAGAKTGKFISDSGHTFFVSTLGAGAVMSFNKGVNSWENVNCMEAIENGEDMDHEKYAKCKDLIALLQERALGDAPTIKAFGKRSLIDRWEIKDRECSNLVELKEGGHKYRSTVRQIRTDAKGKVTLLPELNVYVEVGAENVLQKAVVTPKDLDPSLPGAEKTARFAYELNGEGESVAIMVPDPNNRLSDGGAAGRIRIDRSKIELVQDSLHTEMKVSDEILLVVDSKLEKCLEERSQKEKTQLKRIAQSKGKLQEVKPTPPSTSSELAQ